jgi:NADP-dependent 3-hydroxy acid dehydrogenase YdfG
MSGREEAAEADYSHGMTDSTASAGAADCRTALVTGGTSGLGLAMAAALAGAGLRVAVAGRLGERAAAAAAGSNWT